MDVTPQQLRGSEIKEAFRGYHRDEVDDLLERAAVTIENLTRQVQDVGTRAPAADTPLVSRNDAETIQRTLILAQRAADDAIAEAQERAHQILEESEAKAQTLVGEAEATARRIHEGERHRLEAEVAELIARRDLLQSDADALENYASGYRDRVRAAIEADLANLGAAIDAPSPRPELHDTGFAIPTPAPAPVPAALPAWDDDSTRAVTRVEVEAAELSPEPEPELAQPAAMAPAETGWPPPAPAADTNSGFDAPAPWEPPAALPEVSVPEAQPFSSDIAMEAQPVDTDVLDDDAFFASLRDAVRDDAPLGPVDRELGQSSSFFDDAEPEASSRRFRRR